MPQAKCTAEAHPRRLPTQFRLGFNQEITTETYSTEGFEQILKKSRNRLPCLVSKILWFRVVLLTTPFALVAAGLWLSVKARQFRFSRSADMIYVVQSPPGEFNPFVPNTGVTREITDMIFERLFRRDDDLKLRAHLAESWSEHQRITLRMKDEESAIAGAEILKSEEGNVKSVGILEAKREGLILRAWLNGHDRSKVDEFLALFKPEQKAELLKVRLRIRDSIDQSLGLFLENAVERNQVQMLHYRNDQEADLFLEGDTDLFLKEIRLYYESNRDLEPEIVILDQSSFYTEMDMSLKLRDDLHWQDGEPITAKDVIFSYNELTRPGSIYPLKDDFWFVDSVEEVGALEIRIECAASSAVMLESWEKLPILPAHRLTRNMTDEAWREFFKKPIGSGPYAMLERRDDGGVILAAHTGYFRGAPKQERIIYRMMHDREERLLGMRLGRIDIMEPDPREQLWMERHQDQIRFIDDVPRYQTFVAWNLRRDLFVDPKVRRALALAVDTETIVRECSGDEAKPCRGLYFPGSPYAKKSPNTPGFNLEEAKKKLADAGWKSGPDNQWKLPDGKPATFSIGYDAGNLLNEKLAVELARAWSKLGVDVDIQPLPWPELLGLFPEANFDAVILGWELEVGRNQRSVWHSRFAAPGSSNFCGLRSSEVDSLLEQILLETDPEKAVELTGKLQDKIAELQPALFLCETGRHLAIRRGGLAQVRPRIDGEMTAENLMIGRTGFSAVRPWWVRKEPAPQKE